MDTPADAATTRFGAAWTSPERAVAVLRARASRFGTATAQPSLVDAASAVVAVDAWMLALSADALESPARHGQPAVAALAAALARAAGSGEGGDGPLALDAPPAPSDWLTQLERYLDWAQATAGDGAEVLRRAATDLAAGAADRRLATMAAALSLVAELPADA